MSNLMPLTNVKAGEYLVRLKDVDVGYSRTTGKRRALCHLEFLDAPLAGTVIVKVQNLTTASSVEQFHREWKNLGLNLKDPDELGARVGEFKDTPIKIRVVQGNTPSCYMLTRLPAVKMSSEARAMSFEDVDVDELQHTPTASSSAESSATSKVKVVRSGRHALGVVLLNSDDMAGSWQSDLDPRTGLTS